jgi:4-hydroxy-4-methyl-2-oxoglutarate aldolase
MTNDEVLAELGKIRTPIIYDAVEKFGVRRRDEMTMDPSIKSVLPNLGPMIGYATTAKIVGDQPPAKGERRVAAADVWRYVQAAPSPSVMVVQDLDQPPARSCNWGDVAASIFLELGSVGAVTNGGVRDLPEVEALGFQLFAPSPVVGHAWTRWVEIDTPVKVGSLGVYPGDLIHGDEHGVMVIPKEVPLEELLSFIGKFLASEKTIVDYCTGPDFELDTLIQVVKEHDERTTGNLP